MRLVLTVIADRRASVLSDSLLRDLREAGNLTRPTILARGEAAEFFCSTRPDRDALRAILGGSRIDWTVTRADKRRKALLVADMDGTILEEETLDELAEYAGLRREISAITRAGMNGEIGFAAGLRQRVAMLRGLPATALEETWRRLTVREGARALVATMRAHGASTALVSGGFSCFSERLARLLGFDCHFANTLGLEEGVLSGRVDGPILDREAKRATLYHLAAVHGLSLADTLAVGDGANDIPMLDAAGLGVAFHAKPAVTAAIPVGIAFCDLRALLFAQGYSEREIVSDD